MLTADRVGRVNGWEPNTTASHPITTAQILAPDDITSARWQYS